MFDCGSAYGNSREYRNLNIRFVETWVLIAQLCQFIQQPSKWRVDEHEKNVDFCEPGKKMEEEVLNKLAIQVGWHSFDGILSPGGSINNLYACMIARQRAMPCKFRIIYERATVAALIGKRVCWLIIE